MTEAIRAEAWAILAAAASRAPVELERLQAFATACLAQSVMFRLANGVLRGGTFAPSRAIDLAEHVLALASEPKHCPSCEANRRLRITFEPGSYYCPSCEANRPLSEPCEHIEMTESARATVRQLFPRRELPCNCDVPGQIECEQHGPRE